jgi:RNA recognition motif-containing protein
MARELYVGNIPFEATESDIRNLFSVCGTVTLVHMITDPQTNRFRGCAYVKMRTSEEAADAIESLDGALFKTRIISVEESKPQPAKGVPPTAKRPAEKQAGKSQTDRRRENRSKIDPQTRKTERPKPGNDDGNARPKRRTARRLGPRAGPRPPS